MKHESFNTGQQRESILLTNALQKMNGALIGGIELTHPKEYALLRLLGQKQVI